MDSEGERHSQTLLLGEDTLPFTVMAFMNGAGSVLKKGGPNELIAGRRRNTSQLMATSPNYHQESLIPKRAESHSGTDVAIYARGPWAHLVDGTMEQNTIYHVMLHAVRHGGAPCPGNRDIAAGECNCKGEQVDVCGVCGGKALLDPTTKLPIISAGKCDCVGHVVDECGLCGGYGTDACGVCNGGGIEPGTCDCAGHVQDCAGTCNGTATVDECGVCSAFADPSNACPVGKRAASRSSEEEGDGGKGGATHDFVYGTLFGFFMAARLPPDAAVVFSLV